MLHEAVKNQLLKEAFRAIHGTSTVLGKIKKLKPPSETGIIQEVGRKKNLDKVFVTLRRSAGKIYAGRAKNRLGGKPVVYEVLPKGKLKVITDRRGTEVIMADSADVVRAV